MTIDTSHQSRIRTDGEPRSLGSQAERADVSAIDRVCESFAFVGMYGLARMQKAVAALHGNLYANAEVASFRSGVRFTQAPPVGCEKLAHAAETLRDSAARLARAAAPSFGRDQHAQLTKIVACFVDEVASSERDRTGILAKINARLLSRGEDALVYVRSRPSNLVGPFWPELINQLLEDSALLLHAHESIAAGQVVKVDPHGRFLEPITLSSIQATVDREIHARTLTLARTRAAYNRLHDLAQEWQGEGPISMELLRDTRATFTKFHDILERGMILPDSEVTNSSSGPLSGALFLYEAHAALHEASLGRSRSADQSRRIVELVERICEQELSWAEYSNPFHPALTSSSFRSASEKLSAPPSEQKPPSRFTWEWRGFGRTTFIPRAQRGSGDEPLTSGERHALANWESLLRYGVTTNDARLDALPKGASPILTAHYGGATAVVPSTQRLIEYEEFQKRFMIDPSMPGQQCGLGSYFSAEWLANALAHNALSITEKRRDGELLGLYFLAADEKKLTPLGQAVADWLQQHAEPSTNPFEQPTRAFTEILVGPSSREIYSEFRMWIATGLHEFAEATASFEAGGRSVALYAVCRTKPANTAIVSHERHGWVRTGVTYTIDDGKEYVVINKPIPELAGYEFDGSLRNARLPKLQSAEGEIPFESIVAARNDQRVAAARNEEILRSSQNNPPSAAQSTYHDSTHLYEQVLCSSVSRESGIRAWEVHSADVIATELVRYVCGSEHTRARSSRLERWLAGSVMGKIFELALPERHEHARRDSELLKLAARCERLASRAEHMGAQRNYEWLSDPSYTEKPRMVAHVLRRLVM
jgi:hypothetical protein